MVRAAHRAPLDALGAGLEALSWLVRPLRRFEPVLTRFAVDFVSVDFTVKSDEARRDFGYAPRYGRDEAMARTLEFYRAQDTRTRQP